MDGILMLELATNALFGRCQGMRPLNGNAKPRSDQLAAYADVPDTEVPAEPEAVTEGEEARFQPLASAATNVRDQLLSGVTGHGRKRWREELHEQIIQVASRNLAQPSHEHDGISGICFVEPASDSLHLLKQACVMNSSAM